MTLTATELPGRTTQKEPTRNIIKTIHVSDTEADATAPHQGSALSGVSGTIGAICQGTVINETRYPGKFAFYSTFEHILTRTEFQAL
jgi:hypothetical protein